MEIAHEELAAAPNVLDALIVDIQWSSHVGRLILLCRLFLGPIPRDWQRHDDYHVLSQHDRSHK